MDNQSSMFELCPNDSRKSFYGKATVHILEGVAVLRSYDTNVCAYFGDRFVWSDSYDIEDMSQTTGRHVAAFMCWAQKAPKGKPHLRRALNTGTLETTNLDRFDTVR